jgi:hypothetical protein
MFMLDRFVKKNMKTVNRDRQEKLIKKKGLLRTVVSFFVDEDLIELYYGDLTDSEKMSFRYIVPNSQNLSESFIERWSDKLDWNYVCTYQRLSENFIEKMKSRVKWYYISENQELSEEFIDRWQNFVIWSCISSYQKLSIDFLEKFQDKINWHSYSQNNILNEKILKKFERKIIWRLVHENTSVDPYLFLKYYSYIDSDYLFSNFKFNESDLVNWWRNLDDEGKVNVFLQVKDLSFDFLLNHCDDALEYSFLVNRKVPIKKINEYGSILSDKAWMKISRYQVLSKKFILRWLNRINLDELVKNEKINQDILKDENLEILNLSKRLT